MDTQKWKSVLLPRPVYEELVIIARVEGRTISGQLRYILESWKAENLSKRDIEYIFEQVEEFRKEHGDYKLTSKSFSV
ncbi:MAG: hypothetical protein RLZZ602_1339 [Pseudomonadota bacterium]|jgi:predicted DNA-binding protein